MERIWESGKQQIRQSGISDRTAAPLEAVNGIKADFGWASDIVQSNAAVSLKCSVMVREFSEQARMLDQVSKGNKRPNTKTPCTAEAARDVFFFDRTPSHFGVL